MEKTIGTILMASNPMMRIVVVSTLAAVTLQAAVFADQLPPGFAPGKYDQYRGIKVLLESPLLDEFLPDYEVTALPFLRGSEKALSITNKETGESVRYGEDWSGKLSEHYFYPTREFSEFLAARQIKVTDNASASKVARFISGITSAPMSTKVKMINEDDYSYFDSHPYIFAETEPKHWLYTVEKDGSTWSVIVDYIGPPASIMSPPTYEIEVDSESRFLSIRMTYDRHYNTHERLQERLREREAATLPSSSHRAESSESKSP